MHLLEDPLVAPLYEARAFCRRLEVVEGKLFALAVEGHLVRSGPAAGGVVGVGDVEGGGERPVATLVHQEADVFRVVVLVPCANVEYGPAVHLFDVGSGKPNLPCDGESLLVAVRPRNVEVVVRNGRKRLVVQFATVFGAVEAARHEVPVIAVFQQAAFRHLDSGFLRNLAVGVFKRPETSRVGVFLVAIVLDIVEFQEPVTKAFGGADLPREHGSCRIVIGDENLCAGASGRCPDTDNLFERVFLAEPDLYFFALVQDVCRKGAKSFDFEGFALDGVGTGDGVKLECAHAARAGVAEPFERGKAFRGPAVLDKPLVDNLVAELVGNGIGEKPRQPMEGGGRKVRKTVNGAAAYGHGDRRGFYAAACEVRSIFERGEFVALFLVERPNSRSPELNLDGGHLSSPHTQDALAAAFFLRPARLRWGNFCDSRRSIIGLRL